MLRLEFNGWRFSHNIRLRPGVISNVYRNREGWSAETMFQGSSNRYIGLIVRDEKGKSLGLVKNVSDLP